MNLEGLLRDNEYTKPISCSKCGGRLKYAGLGEYKCTMCRNVEYDDYGKVRVFLEGHPGANIVQTQSATGVSQQLIERMIREGKFEAVGQLSSKKGE